MNTIPPAKIAEAMPWLKRRFHVSENLELSTDLGLCVEVAPRIKSTGKGLRIKVNFKNPEQYALPF